MEKDKAQNVAQPLGTPPYRPATGDPLVLEREVAALLNRYSVENASNTPDFILAQFLLACLAAWNTGIHQREAWYGHYSKPGQP